VGNADIAGANICPCQNDGVSQILVYNDESSSLGIQYAKL